MADQDNDSKTELPTEKHVQEAHSRGQFAKTPEVSVVLMLVAALGVLSMSVKSAGHLLGGYATSVFSNLQVDLERMYYVPVAFGEGAAVVAQILAPIVIAAVLAALLAGGLQSGFTLTTEVLGVKWENLNPMNGAQRIFSKQVLVHGLVDFLKMAGIGFILWMAARAMFEDPMFTSPVEVDYVGRFFQTATYGFLTRVILALGTVAAIAYGIEVFRTRKQLMMTREQVKEERKQSEGDAQTKAAMRRMARRLLQKQMMEAVPTADVVVTNPTHYAVALKYERGRDHAPMVLAKGENRFALRLKALAAEHGVPTVENRPVARALFALGKVGEPIPPQLFHAVAEILATVYRTHRYYFYRLRARRAEAERRALTS